MGLVLLSDILYMIEKSQFHHLTFVTKYSRIPDEETALLRYNVMMEIGKESLAFDSKWTELIWNAFKRQAQVLGINVIIENILSDHAHILIDSNDIPISEIVQKLKWYSSYLYNRTFKHKGPVWAVWYSDMCVDNEKYLENVFKYIKNNHLKHHTKSHYVRCKSL